MRINDLMNPQDLDNVHKTGFDLEEVRVTFLRDVKIQVSGVDVEGKQGEILNLRRWIANILEQEKHIQIQDTDMAVELKQALSKEKMQGEYTLATLDLHFYIKLKSYMQRLEKSDHDNLLTMLNELVRIRRGKILSIADSSKLTADTSSKLTVEEREYYSITNSNSTKFTKQILGDVKQ